MKKRFIQPHIFFFSFVALSLLFFTAGYLQAQNKPCVFCRIAAGEIQARQVVYRDSCVVAFMSHGPQNPGHVLVVPIAHAAQVIEVPDSSIRNMMSVARKIAIAISKTDIKADAFRYQINSGEAAGQSVFHCHLHIIPMNIGDTGEKKEKPPVSELQIVAAKIRKVLE